MFFHRASCAHLAGLPTAGPSTHLSWLLLADVNLLDVQRLCVRVPPSLFDQAHLQMARHGQSELAVYILGPDVCPIARRQRHSPLCPPACPVTRCDKMCTSLPSCHHPCHAPGYQAATHQADPRAPSWRQAQLRQPSCLRQPAPPPSCLLRGQSGLQLLCWSWRRPQRQSLRQSWHPALPGCRQTCRCSR